MFHRTKDNLTDVAQNLPAMAAQDQNQPQGTVVAADGTLVTLGQQVAANTAITHPQGGTNTGVEGKQDKS